MALRDHVRDYWQVYAAVIAVLLLLIVLTGCNATPPAATKPVVDHAAAMKQTLGRILNETQETREAIDAGRSDPVQLDIAQEHINHIEAEVKAAAPTVEAIADTQQDVVVLQKRLAAATSKASERAGLVWIIVTLAGVAGLAGSVLAFKLGGPGWGSTVAVMGGIGVAAGLLLPRFAAIADAIVLYVVWGGGAVGVILIGVVGYRIIKRRDTIFTDLIATVETVKAKAPEAWASVKTAVKQSDITEAVVKKLEPAAKAKVAT